MKRRSSSRVRLSLYMCAGGPRAQEALQRLLSLADVEDAHLKLAGLTLRHPLMGTTALAQHLQRHYMKAALPELLKVCASLQYLALFLRFLGLGDSTLC